MRKSLIIEALYYKVSIVFRKESLINAKKVLNFIQSLTNEKKVIKLLGVPYPFAYPQRMELMYKFLDTTNHVCKIRMQMVNYWTCPDTV